jgi:hypothetical protein
VEEDREKGEAVHPAYYCVGSPPQTSWCRKSTEASSATVTPALPLPLCPPSRSDLPVLGSTNWCRQTGLSPTPAVEACHRFNEDRNPIHSPLKPTIASTKIVARLTVQIPGCLSRVVGKLRVGPHTHLFEARKQRRLSLRSQFPIRATRPCLTNKAGLSVTAPAQTATSPVPTESAAVPVLTADRTISFRICTVTALVPAAGRQQTAARQIRRGRGTLRGRVQSSSSVV